MLYHYIFFIWIVTLSLNIFAMTICFGTYIKSGNIHYKYLCLLSVNLNTIILLKVINYYILVNDLFPALVFIIYQLLHFAHFILLFLLGYAAEKATGKVKFMKLYYLLVGILTLTKILNMSRVIFIRRYEWIFIITLSFSLIFITTIINRRRFSYINKFIQMKINTICKIIAFFSVLIIFETIFSPFAKYGLSVNIIFYNILALTTIYYTDKFIFPDKININSALPKKFKDKYKISEVEAIIIRNVSKGLQNKEIADIIERKEDTVKKHLNSIYKKTGARNRYELISKIIRDHTA